MRELVTNAIEKEKLIVIVRGVGKDKILKLAEAMYEGGIRLLELTYSQSGEISDEEVASSIKLLAEHFGDEPFTVCANDITPVDGLHSST